MSSLKEIIAGIQDIDIHVIFVHGILGNSEDTWFNPSTGFYWPEELQSNLHRVKVWKYDYTSTILGGVEVTITDIALNLLRHIKSKNLIKTGKIVFITHSLGGIIVKQLIRKLFFYSHTVDDFKGMLDHIKGVVFIATPHDGSTYAELMKVFKPIYEIFIDNTVILNDLTPGNTYITELFHEYKLLIGNTNIRHEEFKENKLFNVIEYAKNLIEINKKSFTLGRYPLLSAAFNRISMKYKLQKIVYDHSARSGIGLEPTLINKDHISICKPENRNCLVYKTVNQFINDLIDKKN